MTTRPVRATGLLLSAMLAAGLSACGGSEATTADTPSTSPTSPSPTEVVDLPNGYLTPGRYRFVVSVECERVTDDPVACPDGVPEPPPIPLEVTVPDGWERPAGFPVVWTAGKADAEMGYLVLGWTSNHVRVQSDPCLQKSHQLPDLEVGPGVDDFVDTVTAQDWYTGGAAVDTEVGGASGRSFTLTGPSDLSGCEEWRPWDPGFFAQGPDNEWKVWVLDVRGHRVVVVAHWFPGTSPETVEQLEQMVASISFPSG